MSTAHWTHKLFLTNSKDTEKLGQDLALRLRPGDVVALSGDLGAGKTTLARSLVQSLMGVDVPVPSPTFTLVQHYNAPNKMIIAHYDWYRLRHAEEVLELGFEEDCTTAMTLVEWPERALQFLPARTLTIQMSHEIGAGRMAVLSGSPAWETRLAGLS